MISIPITQRVGTHAMRALKPFKHYYTLIDLSLSLTKSETPHHQFLLKACMVTFFTY